MEHQSDCNSHVPSCFHEEDFQSLDLLGNDFMEEGHFSPDFNSGFRIEPGIISSDGEELMHLPANHCAQIPHATSESTQIAYRNGKAEKDCNRNVIYPKYFDWNANSKPTSDASVEKVFTIMSYPNSAAHTKSSATLTLDALKRDSDVPIKKESLPGSKNYFKPSYSLEEKVDEKKSKKQRNKESAQKCRQRKKQYLTKLEAELKAVKQELVLCKCELEMLKGNLFSKLDAKYNNLKKGLMSQAREIMNHGMIIPKLDEILTKLTVANQELLERKSESMHATCLRFFEHLLPNTYSYFLLDAERDLGFLSSLCVSKGQLVNETEFKANVDYIQSGLRIYRDNIENKMQEFLQAKNELLDEIGKLNNYMNAVVFTQMPVLNVLNAILWIHDGNVDVRAVDLFGLDTGDNACH